MLEDRIGKRNGGMQAPTSAARGLLVALATHEEAAELQRILEGDHWSLHFARTFPETEAALRASPYGIVICSPQFQDGHGWKDLLQDIQEQPTPPQLIVADRLADDALWAEVLNLGGYDLLMTPFEADEVRRVVPMAWRSWERQLEHAAPRSAPRNTSECSEQYAVAG